MELPTQFLRDVMKTILEDIGLDPNSKHDSHKIAAHLLMSALFRVSVYYGDHDGARTKKFIFKTLRQDSEINLKFDTVTFFRNEAMFYTEVLAAFEGFQAQRLGKEYCRYNFAPKCYKAIQNEETYVIVLEDLTGNGYVESSRLKLLDVPELNVVMEGLGRFHAISLAIKDKEPDLFLKLRNSTVKEVLFRTEFLRKRYNIWASAVASWTLKLAKESFPSGSSYVKKLETFATDNMAFHMKDIICPKEEDEQYNVFTHGDLWVNNLLFHYQDDSQKKPDKMCFVDFQQCRYGSLALDISAVLFLLMDQKLRNSHRDELLQAYHQSLSEFLRQLGCDPERLFPFSALEIQLSKYSLFNLGMALLCLTYNLAEDTDDDMACEEDEKSMVNRATEECRSRILDIIRESVDRGYFH